MTLCRKSLDLLEYSSFRRQQKRAEISPSQVLPPRIWAIALRSNRPRAALSGTIQAGWLTLNSTSAATACCLNRESNTEELALPCMSQTRFLKASGRSVKPRSMGLGRLLVRLLVLSVVVCVLFIGVAWAFGALWFDFPVAVLRQPLAAAFGLSAVAALVFVRPHWRAQLGVAGAIVLVTAWKLTIPPSNTRDWQPQVAKTPHEARITPPPDTNRTAKFIALLYHRFEDRPAELVTTPNDFRAQMKALKDNGISVISMQDLLAWRKGEKAIPSKSAVITIDDEWNSQYYVAWPILKEFGYPFTLFVYTQWVNTGGKSTTWAQLAEMRDSGADIEAHTVSHHDLRHAPRGQEYSTWLHNEVYDCKETLETKLGVKIIAFAFPYGFHNEVVRKTAKEAGYEMQFTVYGRHMDINVPADQIGRYAIDSLKGDEFKKALDFGTSDGTQPGVETSQLASAAMLTEPLNDQHITESKPAIKANLASMGDVDPKSLEIRISGFGLVPAVYDPKTKLVTYAFTQKLVPKMYIVILTAKVNGKKVETRWDFTVDPAGRIATDQ
jgi:peptidoglycan/xylan/chitin deacetylase (PgdA/CDA1 family)